MKKWMILLMVLSFSLVSLAYADINTAADTGKDIEKLPAMAGRGLVNVATGPVYLLSEPVEQVQASQGLAMPVGFLKGVFLGAFKTIYVAMTGVIDMVTAPIPGHRGAGAGHGMFPNYKWETTTMAPSLVKK